MWIKNRQYAEERQVWGKLPRLAPGQRELSACGCFSNLNTGQAAKEGGITYRKA